MQLDTIEISPDEAKARLAEYEALLQEERTIQDYQIAAGYKAAARGLPIIRLSETIAAGGYFAYGLPRIAVIRATAQVCYVYRENVTNTTDFVFTDANEGWHQDRNRGALVNRRSVRVRVPFDESHRIYRSNQWSAASTIIPAIPPRHRPRRRRLRGFHILWEVEQWDRVVPRDPALLRHIAGDLWAVHAVWDLTDLERAVLLGRLAP
jgi:hypothetical protein